MKSSYNRAWIERYGRVYSSQRSLPIPHGDGGVGVTGPRSKESAQMILFRRNMSLRSQQIFRHGRNDPAALVATLRAVNPGKRPQW